MPFLEFRRSQRPDIFSCSESAVSSMSLNDVKIEHIRPFPNIPGKILEEQLSFTFEN